MIRSMIDCLYDSLLSILSYAYHKYHENQAGLIDIRKKKLNWGENSVRDLPGRYAITICNSDDATQSHI